MVGVRGGRCARSGCGRGALFELHRRQVTALVFSASPARLWSLDEEGGVCRVDPATAKHVCVGGGNDHPDHSCKHEIAGSPVPPMSQSELGGSKSAHLLLGTNTQVQWFRNWKPSIDENVTGAVPYTGPP